MSNDIQSVSPADDTEKTPTEKSKKAHTPILSWVNFLLIIILLALAAIAGWLAWQYQQNTSSEISALEERLGKALAGVEQSSNKEAELFQRAESLANQAEGLAAQVTHNTERLAKLPGAERQDWLLAEAEYLMRLANQRLQLERDWSGAVSMLTAADNVLIETRNPGYNKVREQIAKELLALRAVPAIDKTGAIYRIQALQEQLQTLPWMPEKLVVKDMPEVEETRSLDKQTWYWNLWFVAKENVARMIRIQQRDEPIAAPLSPDQQYYLQQNMHLMLEQAQVALLREQTELYKHSMERVSEWLNQYLVIEDERTRAARASLDELASWVVDPKRPDISGSLIMLQKLVEEQRRGTVTSAEASS